MSDSHLPQLRQLFEDPRCLENSEFIVVQAPENKAEVVRDKERGKERAFDAKEADWAGGGVKGEVLHKQRLTVQRCTEECDPVFW